MSVNLKFKNNQSIVFKSRITHGIWNQTLINQLDYTHWTVESGFQGRPDLISNHFYNISAYDWIIIMVNKPLNPIGWPHMHNIIKIPDYNQIIRL